ncbi:MAG: alpha-amylase family glycosyl hydrolase [Candidatus Hodarchaeales archaeon]
MYPRSFFDSNNDGIGDLQGIISKLNYLEWLGVNAIWLSPFYKSPMKDFGYDVSDYCQIDPIFGTMSDFDNLVERIHKKNMKLIIDFVPNHTSDQHKWFIESRSSKNNPKRDWYIWKDPKENGGPPNNWICVTGGSAWQWDEKTQQYYLHSFLPCQPDLNWSNESVRKAMFDVLRFWLRKGVDGFRIDMISWLSKDPNFSDDYLNENFNPKTDYGYQQLIHIHSRDGPELYSYLRQIKSVLEEFEGDQVLIGETDYYLPLRKLDAYYENGIDLPANFRLIYLTWQVRNIKGFIDEYISPERSHTNFQLGNHDQTRVVTRLGVKQARIAALMLLTLRGTPFIYYGEELGMHNVTIPPLDIQDPWERTEPGKGRDPERTPMQWDNRENAGFSKVKPWLKVSTDYRLLNVLVEKQNRKSFLHLYHKLLSLRKEYISLSVGKYKSFNLNENCFIYLRSYQDEKFLILLNFSNEEQTIGLECLKNSMIILSTFLDREDNITNDSVMLRKQEGCLIKLK